MKIIYIHEKGIIKKQKRIKSPLQDCVYIFCISLSISFEIILYINI